MKRENNHKKNHPHLGKKIKLTKSNTNVEQKNPTQKNMPGIILNDIERPISEFHNSLNSDSEICHSISKKEHELRQKCRKVGINFESRKQIENENEMSKILKKNYDKLRRKIKTLGLNLENIHIPEAPEQTNDKHLDHAFDCIRPFELQEMSYSVKCCSICNECKINMKLKNDVCEKCIGEKNTIKMFSSENNMDPGKILNELKILSIVEQQLIARISPCIYVHML
jgi:hypothetical protein